jgi:hypothetical protein
MAICQFIGGNGPFQYKSSKNVFWFSFFNGGDLGNNHISGFSPLPAPRAPPTRLIATASISNNIPIKKSPHPAVAADVRTGGANYLFNENWIMIQN